MQTKENLMEEIDSVEELENCIRNRYIEQKFFYFQEGADEYYSGKEIDDVYAQNKFSNEKLLSLRKENNFNNNDRIAFISLGCGNAHIEKTLLEEGLGEYNIEYIGIDSSEEMIHEAMENMKNISVPQHFLHADFSKGKLRKRLSEITKDYDQRVFAFFSNTFGNLYHTDIIDILYNLLQSGDKIWMDVRLRKGITAKDDMEVFDTIHKYLQFNDQEFDFNPLKRLGIPFNNGKMALHTVHEKAINALKFKFSFVFTKKTNIEINHQEIIILPDERIELMTLYTYDADSLIAFFKEHKFKLIIKDVKPLRGQFLFERI